MNIVTDSDKMYNTLQLESKANMSEALLNPSSPRWIWSYHQQMKDTVPVSLQLVKKIKDKLFPKVNTDINVPLTVLVAMELIKRLRQVLQFSAVSSQTLRSSTILVPSPATPAPSRSTVFAPSPATPAPPADVIKKDAFDKIGAGLRTGFEGTKRVLGDSKDILVGGLGYGARATSIATKLGLATLQGSYELGSKAVKKGHGIVSNALEKGSELADATLKTAKEIPAWLEGKTDKQQLAKIQNDLNFLTSAASYFENKKYYGDDEMHRKYIRELIHVGERYGLLSELFERERHASVRPSGTQLFVNTWNTEFGDDEHFSEMREKLQKHVVTDMKLKLATCPSPDLKSGNYIDYLSEPQKIIDFVYGVNGPSRKRYLNVKRPGLGKTLDYILFFKKAIETGTQPEMILCYAEPALKENFLKEVEVFREKLKLPEELDQVQFVYFLDKSNDLVDLINAETQKGKLRLSGENTWIAVDECHHIPNLSFEKIANKAGSANPHRFRYAYLFGEFLRVSKCQLILGSGTVISNDEQHETQGTDTPTEYNDIPTTSSIKKKKQSVPNFRDNLSKKAGEGGAGKHGYNMESTAEYEKHIDKDASYSVTARRLLDIVSRSPVAKNTNWVQIDGDAPKQYDQRKAQDISKFLYSDDLKNHFDEILQSSSNAMKLKTEIRMPIRNASFADGSRDKQGTFFAEGIDKYKLVMYKNNYFYAEDNYDCTTLFTYLFDNTNVFSQFVPSISDWKLPSDSTDSVESILTDNKNLIRSKAPSLSFIQNTSDRKKIETIIKTGGTGAKPCAKMYLPCNPAQKVFKEFTNLLPKYPFYLTPILATVAHALLHIHFSDSAPKRQLVVFSKMKGAWLETVIEKKGDTIFDVVLDSVMKSKTNDSEKEQHLRKNMFFVMAKLIAPGQLRRFDQLFNKNVAFESSGDLLEVNWENKQKMPIQFKEFKYANMQNDFQNESDQRIKSLLQSGLAVRTIMWSTTVENKKDAQNSWLRNEDVIRLLNKFRSVQEEGVEIKIYEYAVPGMANNTKRHYDEKTIIVTFEETCIAVGRNTLTSARVWAFLDSDKFSEGVSVRDIEFSHIDDGNYFQKIARGNRFCKNAPGRVNRIINYIGNKTDEKGNNCSTIERNKSAKELDYMGQKLQNLQKLAIDRDLASIMETGIGAIPVQNVPRKDFTQSGFLLNKKVKELFGGYVQSGMDEVSEKIFDDWLQGIKDKCQKQDVAQLKCIQLQTCEDNLYCKKAGGGLYPDTCMRRVEGSLCDNYENALHTFLDFLKSEIKAAKLQAVFQSMYDDFKDLFGISTLFDGEKLIYLKTRETYFGTKSIDKSFFDLNIKLLSKREEITEQISQKINDVKAEFGVGTEMAKVLFSACFAVLWIKRVLGVIGFSPYTRNNVLQFIPYVSMLVALHIVKLGTEAYPMETFPVLKYSIVKHEILTSNEQINWMSSPFHVFIPFLTMILLPFSDLVLS